MTIGYDLEVKTGHRFEFGKNWQAFLPNVDEDRIQIAQASVKSMLGISTLEGKTFLDIGCGSGVFSLAAVRLGARAVHSFDYDPHSVECSRRLQERFGSSLPNWSIEQGSALDVEYIHSLGHFDVVYSWGVLHHTGNMWGAMENVIPLVATNGVLFIAIYNRQPFLSGYWKLIKRLYNGLPKIGQVVMEVTFLLLYGGVLAMADLLRGQNPTARWGGHRKRGMSMYVDIKDWIGGYPFEVAAPEEVFRFYRDRGFSLQELITCGGKHGCNQYVFRRNSAISTPETAQ